MINILFLALNHKTPLFSFYRLVILSPLLQSRLFSLQKFFLVVFFGGKPLKHHQICIPNIKSSQAGTRAGGDATICPSVVVALGQASPPP